jgi:hypothetical protein
VTPEQIQTAIAAPLLDLPGHLREGLRDYLVHRQEPGGFLRAVLENDFRQSVLNADPISADALKDIARFLENDAPPSSHGSARHVYFWLKGGN